METTIRLDDQEQAAAEAMAESPEMRIRTVENARFMFTKLDTANTTFDMNLAMIRGLIDGNPPFRPDRLREKNLEDKTNINFRQMEGIIANWVTTYHDLLSSVRNLVDAQCNVLEVDNELKHNWEQVIAEEMSRVIKAWDSFYIEMMLHQVEMTATGLGPLHFPHPTSWQFESVSRSAVLNEPATKAGLGNMDYFFIRDTMPMKELYARVRNVGTSEVAEGMGWIPQAIKQALVRYGKGTGMSSASEAYAEGEWTGMQEQIRNNDLGWAVDKEDIPIAHLYVREFDGSITHAIFDTGGDISDFLYRKTDAYVEWKQAIHMFLFEIMNRRLRGAKGLGHKSFAHVQTNNRLMCHLIDSAFAHATLIFQGADGVDTVRAKIYQWGPRTVMPAGMQFRQSLMGTPMDGPLSIQNMVTQQLKANTRIDTVSRADLTGRSGNKTAQEVRDDSSGQADVERAKILHYYTQLDSLYAEVYRRLVLRTRKPGDPSEDLAKEFQSRCIQRGVPPEILFRDYVTIAAARSIGFGSPRNRRQALGTLNAIKGEFDEIGRRRLNRDIVVDEVGHSNADRYYPDVDRDRIPSTDTTLVALENAHLQQGAQIPVGADQLHKIHAEGHTAPVVQLMQAHQSGQGQVDPQQAVVYVDAWLGHMAAHLQYLELDPIRKAEFMQYRQVHQQVVRWRAQLDQQLGMIRQAQQQQAQAQKADMDRRMQEAARDHVAEASAKAQAAAQQKVIVGLAKVEADRQVGMARVDSERDQTEPNPRYFPK